MVQQLGRRTVANSMRRATATIASFSTKPAQATKVSRHAEQKSYINFQDTLMPGSRVVYLTEGDDETASVTVPFLQSIQDRTKLYSSNSFVEAIGFESKNSKTFCRGIDTMNTSKADQRQCLIQLRELNEMLTSSKGAGRSSPPVSLVALNGEISDAGLTAFWGATHRLGSLSAKFRVAAMKDHGQLPIGGVASALVDGDQQNIAMARYLALSGAKLNILDLCQLGLVEHVVSDRPLVPIFRQLAQTNHSNDGTKREQPRHVDIGALEDVLTTMAVDEPEILEEIEMHPVWESSLMVPPSEVASNVANEPQQYPVFAGKTWEEVAAFEAAAPDVFSAESPGGLSALFENIEAFVENCFGANHDVRSSKRALEQYIAGLEKQMASSGMGRSALTYATIDKRNAAIAMQRKLYLAKSCMKTMDLTDAAIVQTWFDLTRHAATKDFDGCMRDEITMWK